MHEVIERWTQLFTRPPLIERWEQGMCDDAEREIAERIVDLWRRRLCDVSWYMRCLNEHLARRANAEDRCAGRFWEGRFKSQALLDESGLLTAMVYVDLNPIRAGIAATPEESEFTSIHERIREFREAKPTTSDRQSSESRTRASPPLLAFASVAQPAEPTIPFTLQDYMALVDWTGRARRADKRGAIDPHAPAIMQRLNLDADAWRMAMQSRGNVFGRALGRLDHLRLHAKTLGQSWVRGLQRAERMYAL